MHVVIAGGHGKVALALERQLVERKDTVASLIRNPDHAPEVAATGAKPVQFDLESGGIVELSKHLTDADAVVFAAGAGPGSGKARKDTVDRAGAALLAEAAQRAAVRRYVLVGSMGLPSDAMYDPGWAPPEGTDPVFAAYLKAKAASERDLAGRDLDWTVVRPGSLTDREAAGTVRLGETGIERGEVSREDVAAVIVEVLHEPRTVGKTLELVGGDTPIDEAVRAVL